MIDHLRHMAIFARVVDEGSFRAAAKDLGLSPSRVSETVTALEDFLGATLLYRTTRKIALTSEGRVFYARVVDMLRSAETGLNELNALSLEPVGALRVSMPDFMSSSGLSTAIGEFIRRHPLVAVSVSYTDHPVDLLHDGFDLAVRVGWLDDSSMMSRKLGEEGRTLVAGADYASSRPEPRHPHDLDEWDWIKYELRAEGIEFTSQDGETAKVVGNAQLQIDNVDAMFHFARQNLGAAILPKHLADQGLRSGEFVHLLPDWKLRSLGFFAVWPDKSRRENLTLLFVRFLAENFGY